MLPRSAGEVALLRGDFARGLPAEAVASRPGTVATYTSTGERVVSGTNVGRVRCRVAPLGTTPQEQAIQAQEQATALWTLTLSRTTGPADGTGLALIDGADVQSWWTLTIGADVYTVVGPLGPGTDTATTRAVCRKE